MKNHRFQIIFLIFPQLLATHPDYRDKTHTCPQSLSQAPTKIISKVCLCGEKDVPLQQTRQYMDSSDEKALMESLDPVIVELLNENVRLRGEIDRLRERLDNKSKLMLYQEGYIDIQSQAIKTLKSDKYQKPKYQEKLKEADDRHKSRIKSLEASYLYKEETLRIYIDNFREEKIKLVEENKRLRNNIKDLKTDVYEKPAFKELLQDAVIDYIRKLKSQEALYESKLHIQKSINKLLGKEIAELKAKLSEDLNKS